MTACPACFPNDKHFQEWMALARISAETVNVCTDCTPEYETEMRLQERCHRDEWEPILFVRERVSKASGASEKSLAEQSRLATLCEMASKRARRILARIESGVQKGGGL